MLVPQNIIFYLNNNLYVTEEFDTVIPSYFNLKHSMVNHYNLLGDPYVSINVPEQSLNVAVDNTIPAVGDTIHVNLSTPFASGNGLIELTNEKNEPLEESFLFFNDFGAQASFEIQPELQNQLAYIKAYAINSSGTADARGLARLAINKALLDSLVITPQLPKVGEALSFSAFITSPLKIQRVQIKNLKGPDGRYNTFDLARVADSVWTSTEPFGPYLSADTIFFDLQMYDTVGTAYLSRQHKLVISDPRPDLRILTDRTAFNGTEQIELKIPVQNNSDTLLSDVRMHVYLDSLQDGSPPFMTAQQNLNPNQIRDFSFVVQPESLSAG